MPEVDAFIDACLASGAGVVVLAAHTGADGYDDAPGARRRRLEDAAPQPRPALDHAAARGVLAALHPHMGTMVETGDEVDRVLDGSAVGLCLDTGHLLVGGADPVALTRGARRPGRATCTSRTSTPPSPTQVIAGEVAFGDAVQAGVFRPLGEGDVDIAAIVAAARGRRLRRLVRARAGRRCSTASRRAPARSRTSARSLDFLLEAVA